MKNKLQQNFVYFFKVNNENFLNIKADPLFARENTKNLRNRNYLQPRFTVKVHNE